MHRAAPFIGPPAQPVDGTDTNGAHIDDVCSGNGKPIWVLYRTEFELSVRPDRARLTVGSDGEHCVFVNGARVGWGAAPASARRARLTHHDPCEELRSGRNAIGILVRCPPRIPQEPWEGRLTRGGLYVDSEIFCADDVVALDSSSGWRCRVSDAWSTEHGDGLEVHDSRDLPCSWAESGFADRDWPMAQELTVQDAGLRLTPFPELLVDSAPRSAEFAIVPESLVRVDGIRAATELPPDRRAFEGALVPPPRGLVESPSALLGADETATVLRTHRKLGISFLVDFACVHPGRVFVELDANGGEVLELVTAEALPGEGYVKSHQPLRPHRGIAGGRLLCRYTARPGRQRFECAERVPLRYVQLVVRSAHRPVRILRIGSTATLHKLPGRGAFHCSDASLEDLWTSSRDTLEERLAWRDDPQCAPSPGGHLAEMLSGQAAFGTAAAELDRTLLLDTAACQRADGLVTPLDGERAVPVPEDTLLWILAVHGYHLFSGDDETLERVLPAVQRGLEWFRDRAGPDGLLGALPYRPRLSDWRRGAVRDETVPNVLLVGALRAAESLTEALEMRRASPRYHSSAAALAKGLNDGHWDPVSGVFCDRHPGTGELASHPSPIANALALLFRVAPERATAGIATALRDASQERGPFAQAGARALDATPLAAHFTLSALARSGHFNTALALLRARWLPMLERGLRTPWEGREFSRGEALAVATTPLHHLTSHALGIESFEAGFRKVRIAPKPADLEWVEGVFPTPRGDISVAWKRGKEWMELKVQVPPAMRVTIAGPDGYDRVERGGVAGEGQYEVRLLASEQAAPRARPNRGAAARPSLVRALGRRNRS